MYTKGVKEKQRGQWDDKWDWETGINYGTYSSRRRHFFDGYVGYFEKVILFRDYSPEGLPGEKFHLFIFVHGYLVPTKEFKDGIRKILQDVRDIFKGEVRFQLI